MRIASAPCTRAPRTPARRPGMASPKKSRRIGCRRHPMHSLRSRAKKQSARRRGVAGVAAAAAEAGAHRGLRGGGGPRVPEQRGAASARREAEARRPEATPRSRQQRAAVENNANRSLHPKTIKCRQLQTTATPCQWRLRRPLEALADLVEADLHVLVVLVQLDQLVVLEVLSTPSSGGERPLSMNLQDI